MVRTRWRCSILRTLKCDVRLLLLGWMRLEHYLAMVVCDGLMRKLDLLSLELDEEGPELDMLKLELDLLKLE